MQVSRFFTLVCFVIGLMILAACGASNDIGAPEIFYGQDVCDECSMLISDAKFAAATIDLNNNTHKFDDIGGMLVYHMDHPASQVRVWFVHDYNTGAWLRGETAFFVRATLPDAPMQPGIVAFAEQAAAESFATRVEGQVLKFDELRVYVHLTLHNAP